MEKKKGLTSKDVNEIVIKMMLDEYGLDYFLNLIESGKKYFTNPKAYYRSRERIKDIWENNRHLGYRLLDGWKE